MQNSPLQLESYFLNELFFSVESPLLDIPESDVKYPSVQFQVNVDSNPMGEDSRRWRCELAIQSRREEGEQLPYQFRVSMIGFFQISKEWPEEKVEMVARVNGPALLYSAAREILISVTGRGVFPPFILPSVTFIPLAAASAPKEGTEKVEENRGKSSTVTADSVKKKPLRQKNRK